MRLIKSLVIVAICICFMSVPGCGKGDKESSGLSRTTRPTEPEKTTAEPLPGTLEPGVLATVNGVAITQKQLDDTIKPHLDRLTRQAANLPPAFLERQKKELTDNALKELVRMQLLNEKVEAANITVSDRQVTDELTRVAAAQKPPKTLQQFERWTVLMGHDLEHMKSQIRTTLAHNKLMVRTFPDEVKFTEEDAKAYYEANKDKLTTPEQIRASHILIKTARPDSGEGKAAAMAKTEDLLKQLKEGADFAALAKTNSDCPSAQRGGDLSFFQRGRMVPPFDKAAFELTEIGDLSEIVETQFGFHIIKLTGRKDAVTTSYEEAKDRIMRQQTQKKLRELALKYAEKLEADAKIVYAPGMEPE